MVECTGLENRRTARYRGFESLPDRSLERPSTVASAVANSESPMRQSCLRLRHWRTRRAPHRQISKGRGRGRAIGEVAAALVRADEPAAAKRLVGGLSDSAADAEAYRHVGRAFIESTRAAELREWLDEKPPLAAGYACIGAAEGFTLTETRGSSR